MKVDKYFAHPFWMGGEGMQKEGSLSGRPFQSCKHSKGSGIAGGAPGESSDSIRGLYDGLTIESYLCSVMWDSQPSQPMH